MKQAELIFFGIVLSLILYLLFTSLQAIWPFTIDDMYISLRYAKHWATGHGIVWNIDEPAVEGYSNFLFVALGALAIKCHFDPVIVLKISGVLGLLASLTLVYALSRFWLRPIESLLTVLTVLLYKGQIIWAVSGLETTVYEAWVLLGLYCLLKADHRQRGSLLLFCMAGISLAGAALSRPEAPALFVLWFLIALSNKSQKPTWKELTLWAIGFSMIFAPYFLWHWFYFGRLFPNSVYCKGFISEPSIVLDWNYLKLIIPFIPFLWGIVRQNWEHRFLYFLVPSVLYLILLFHSDPIVAFDNRLFIPAFVLLMIVVIVGYIRLMGLLIYKEHKLYYLGIYAFWLVYLFLFLPSMGSFNYSQFTENPLKGEKLRAQVVAFLEQNVDKKNRIVLGDCGFIPYVSDYQFIDSYCLNNLEMTKSSSSQRYINFCEQMMQLKPEVFILTSLKENDQLIYTPSDACLKEKLMQNKDYRFIRVFSAGDDDSLYRYELYESKT